MNDIVSEALKNKLVARVLTETTPESWDKTNVELLLELNAEQFNEAIAKMLVCKPASKHRPVAIPIGAPHKPLALGRKFNPSQFIGNGWTVWKGCIKRDGLSGDEEQDARSLTLNQIDFRSLSREVSCLSGLEHGEKSIAGETKRARLLPKLVQADARISQALYEEEGQTTLEFLFGALGLTWLEFLGTTLRRFDGIRYSLHLYRIGSGSWNWSYGRLAYPRYVHNPALCFAG